RVPEIRGRQVRRVSREPARIVPGRAGRSTARGAGRRPHSLRNAAVAERARDAPPRAADDDAADDRSGAAPHTPDERADGADTAATAGGTAVKIAIATAIGALAAAGIFPQSDPPPVSHEYADVNGVKLHYARAGRGPLMIFLHGFPEF